MVIDDGVCMVQWQQVYDGMPVGLHFISNALVCESAHLLYPHNNLTFKICRTIKIIQKSCIKYL